MKLFLTPIPCTYTSLPLDGMARNYLFYLPGYARARNSVMSGSIFILLPYTREKNHLDNAGIKPNLPALQASRAGRQQGGWWVEWQGLVGEKGQGERQLIPGYGLPRCCTAQLVAPPSLSFTLPSLHLYIPSQPSPPPPAAHLDVIKASLHAAHPSQAQLQATQADLGAAQRKRLPADRSTAQHSTAQHSTARSAALNE